MPLLLGIDLGTSSVKVLLMDTAGKVLGQAGEDYDIQMPRPSYAEQDPAQWWRATCAALAGCLRQAGCDTADIAGIGLSGQMHGLVPLDKAGEVIRPAILHCDARSARQVADIHALVAQNGWESDLLNPVFPGFLLPSLCWMQAEEPQNMARLHSVVLPKDYIRYRLTGAIGTDYSDASATLAFDIPKGRWHRPLLAALGLDAAWFPPCGASTQTAGGVSARAARETGLAPGTPVVYGGGDQVMQSIGNGVVTPQKATVTIGTSGQFFCPTASPVHNPAQSTHSFCAYDDAHWFIMGAMLSAGVSLKWFSSVAGGDLSFKERDALAAQVPPGCEGLLFLPYLSGERTPHMDPGLSGMFIGLGLGTRQETMARAVMEGVAYALKQCRDVCAALGAAPELVLASGGVVNSPLWLQILADVLKCPLHIAQTNQAAAVGAAIAAGVGAGVYAGVQQGTAAAVRYAGQVVQPNPANSGVYRRGYALFQKAHECNRELMRELKET